MMKYYLLYNSKNEIIGYSNCLNIIDGVECREVSKEEYENYLSTKNVPTQKELNQQKIAELKQWFESDYRAYCEMLTRRQALSIDDKIVDQFRNKTYTNLTELYEEAEVVSKEIRELRK